MKTDLCTFSRSNGQSSGQLVRIGLATTLAMIGVVGVFGVFAAACTEGTIQGSGGDAGGTNGTGKGGSGAGGKGGTGVIIDTSSKSTGGSGGGSSAVCNSTDTSSGCRRQIPEGCGDGVNNQNGIEECDDGNVLPGDGCNGICRIEKNWSCP